jgi:tryptophan 2,3-dioxygenase
MSTSKLTYGSYLKIPELLSLQKRVSEPPHHDEMLFIIIHQVHELWFKQVLHELEAIRGALFAGRTLAALKSFKRVHAIQHVLIEQIDVLETMTPAEFNAFRSLLRPASGFQSMQFREVEFLSGAGDLKILSHMQEDPGLASVMKRTEEKTIYQAFLQLLHDRGFSVPMSLLGAPADARSPRAPHPEVVEAFRQIYEEAAENPARFELHLLAEAFVEYDELLLHWRHRHVRMVERTIGMKQGTGGSDGAGYLHKTLSGKLFPELWEVRTVLGA